MSDSLKSSRMKWTETEQTRFLGGFVLGTVFTATAMMIAFYNGYGT